MNPIWIPRYFGDFATCKSTLASAAILPVAIRFAKLMYAICKLSTSSITGRLISSWYAAHRSVGTVVHVVPDSRKYRYST